MGRVVASLCVFASLGAAPAAAHAEDPLLSGYGAPGGGEQAILGVAGGSSGSSSGGGAAGAQPSSGASAAPAPAPAVTVTGALAATPSAASSAAQPSVTTSRSDRRGAPREHRSSAGGRAPRRSGSATSAAPAPVLQIRSVPTAPGGEGAASASLVGPIALTLGGAVLLALLAAAMTRTERRAARPA